MEVWENFILSLFFVFILPFVIFIFYLFFKGKKQAWKGEIIDKKITTTDRF
jgi:preprotein translocase subunit YajC